MNITYSHRLAVLATGALAIALAVPVPALAAFRADHGSLVPAPSTASPMAPAQPAADVTDAVESTLEADLAFMREEEKLARDVYNVLAAKWDIRVFSNIARSEQVHTDAILTLIERYGFTDPTENQPAGVFTDPHLQELYDQLVAKGLSSSAEALEVGKLIEETDIADLDARIARTTQPDVQQVYANLRAGSVNHLAAFEKQIAGGTGPSATSGARGRRGGR